MLISQSMSYLRCEAFPSYPRTYDMIHADGLLSLETQQHQKCTILDLFLDIDRLLRPEVRRMYSEITSHATGISHFV